MGYPNSMERDNYCKVVRGDQKKETSGRRLSEESEVRMFGTKLVTTGCAMKNQPWIQLWRRGSEKLDLTAFTIISIPITVQQIAKCQQLFRRRSGCLKESYFISIRCPQGEPWMLARTALKPHEQAHSPVPMVEVVLFSFSLFQRGHHTCCPCISSSQKASALITQHDLLGQSWHLFTMVTLLFLE